MPRKDGAGPYGQGSGSGGGMGQGIGRGQSIGGGRKGGNRPGAGPTGECVCPSCGSTVSHQRGVPCYTVNCPKCGTKMVRG